LVPTPLGGGRLPDLKGGTHIRRCFMFYFAAHCLALLCIVFCCFVLLCFVMFCAMPCYGNARALPHSFECARDVQRFHTVETTLACSYHGLATLRGRAGVGFARLQKRSENIAAENERDTAVAYHTSRGPVDPHSEASSDNYVSYRSIVASCARAICVVTAIGDTLSSQKYQRPLPARTWAV